MSILKMIVFVVDINYLIKLLWNYSLTFNCSNYHLRLPFAITFTINLENINTFGGWGLTLVAYENKAFLCLPFEIDPTNTFEHILPYWKKNTYTLSFKSNRLWLSLSNSLDKSASWKSEWNPKRFIIRLLPQSLNSSISKFYRP